MSAEDSNPENNLEEPNTDSTPDVFDNTGQIPGFFRGNKLITKSYSSRELNIPKYFGRSPQTPLESLEVLSSLSSGNTSPVESYTDRNVETDVQQEGSDNIISSISKKLSERRAHKGKTMSYNNSPVSRPGEALKKSKFSGEPILDTPTRLVLKGPDNFSTAFEKYRDTHKPKDEVKDLIVYSKSKSKNQFDMPKKDGMALFETFSMKDLKEYLNKNC